MTTRSAYKCCVSAVTLVPEEAMHIQGRVISVALLRSWVSKYGPCMPDGSEWPDIDVAAWLPEMTPPEQALKDRQLEFIELEMNTTLTKILSEQNGYFLYTKVLLAWLVVLDARSFMEIVTRALNICSHLDSIAYLEAYIVLFTNVLSSMLLLSGPSKVVECIDDQKQTLRYQMDDAIWHYAVTGAVRP